MFPATKIEPNMEKNLSLILAILMAALCASAPWFFYPCGTQASCYDGIQNQDEVDIDCGGTFCVPCGNGPEPPSCEINPDFQVEFDREQCAIQISNAVVGNCVFEVSTDGGQSWEQGSTTSPTPLSGSGCEVYLRLEGEDGAIQPFQGALDCPCEPEFDEESVRRVVRNPENYFLSRSECRCENYTFVFPGGLRIAALEATLYLRFEHSQGRDYEVTAFDHEQLEIRLIRRT